MYTEAQLVRVAKRENNNKRAYLVVNALQGKHMPVDPGKALALFGALADELKKAYPLETLLLVGFAETATAIGAALAVELNAYYMQTTREDIDGVEYLFFTESHSHATEQRLVKTDLDAVIGRVQRIVFVEDEVTTGNTIRKIVELIRKSYSEKIGFSVASLLNGMDEEHLEEYRDQNIGLHYLVKTDHSGYTKIAGQYPGNGDYFGPDFRAPAAAARELQAGGRMDARRLVTGSGYQDACEELLRQIGKMMGRIDGKRILVLGTEEFMYPAIFIGSRLKGCEVRTHSTTRSPIAVSREEEYPLHRRYELRSLYERDRVTYLYDPEKYDEVLIITDAVQRLSEAENSLVNALIRCGNEKITLVRWI